MGKVVKKALVLLLVSSVVSAVVGCKQQTEETTKAQSVAPDASQVPTIVEEIIVGNSDDSSSMPPVPLTPKDDIGVVLKTNVPSKGGNLEVALFDIGNGRHVGVQNERIPPDHAGTSKFTFKSQDGWAPGRYMLEIKIDGKLAGQRDFDVIDLPPTPSKES